MNKETIELVKKMVEDGNLPQEVAMKYCPEIEKEGDEKIRKELIRAFQSLNTLEIWNGIKRSDILAWLEEQGEQGPNTMTKPFTFDDILALQCAMTYAKINDYELYVVLQGLHDRILDVYYDEKQGEHKSVEKKELGKIESESAWSEEDELNLSEALHHIRMYNLADKADKLDKWLKDLKDRVSCGK